MCSRKVCLRIVFEENSMEMLHSDIKRDANLELRHGEALAHQHMNEPINNHCKIDDILKCQDRGAWNRSLAGSDRMRGMALRISRQTDGPTVF